MLKKKKILIHSIAFFPDGVSTAYLYNDIALAFKEAGYEVVVLTTTPHYNVVSEQVERHAMTKKIFGLYYEGDYFGIPVKHIPQVKFKSTFLRLLGFVYWHLLALILGLLERKVDVILSPSPPLTIGLVNLIIAKFKGAKVIYNVQEIYPDFLIEQGGLKSKPVIKLLKSLEKFVYNKSAAVTTIDQVFYDTIIPRFENNSKLHIVPNFVDTDLYKPYPGDLNLDRTVFPENKNIKLMYAGNVGHAQDWEPLLKTAILLREEPIEFFIIGEGVMKEYVQKAVLKNGLSKVHVLPYQPRELMPQLLAYADLQFIFMSKEMEGHGFPSKVYTIMACAKPLIVCSGEGTPIVNFLKDYNCAKIITERNEYDKVQHIVAFLKTTNHHQLVEMGKDGYGVVHNYYSKPIVTGKYVSIVKNLLHD
ncbi:glycosyl transferase family 1 [Sphingobacterium sp. ML3W]|uniref:glycosyltransferase family 4 protein n=1 Tax=Sphingobacterium sp. ML3W TaxID=1538644 RepID=UPI0004F8AA6B|nr:glycosyltransferase family 4 protein [Sphingobacterium sp. ML3W]AIM39164.1 glycosyl transferase family 1 [Sphingobacterium sp. ML3W]